MISYCGSDRAEDKAYNKHPLEVDKWFNETYEKDIKETAYSKAGVHIPINFRSSYDSKLTDCQCRQHGSKSTITHIC